MGHMAETQRNEIKSSNVNQGVGNAKSNVEDVEYCALSASCKVDKITGRGAGFLFHRYLRPFLCDPFLNSFELILDLDVVRSLEGVVVVCITCRDMRSSLLSSPSSSSERSSMISISSSLSRLTPALQFFLPSTLEDGPGRLSGGGEGDGDRGRILWALRISVT